MKNGRSQGKIPNCHFWGKTQYKSNTKFLNESKDSTQVWHRYGKVLAKKTNNIVEPIYDTESVWPTYLWW